MPTYKLIVDGFSILEFESPNLSQVVRRAYASQYAKQNGISDKGVFIVEKIISKKGAHLEKRLKNLWKGKNCDEGT